MQQIQEDDKTIKEIIDLRRKILREPLGVSFTDDELLSESVNNHFIAIVDIKSKDLIGALLRQMVHDPTQLKMRQVSKWDLAGNLRTLRNLKTSNVYFYMPANQHLIFTSLWDTHGKKIVL